MNRFERKFVAKDLYKITPYLLNKNFSKAYPTRKITSIYYDTEDYSCFTESENGNSIRKKIRIRFYEDNINDLKLEIKSKNSDLGSKKFFNPNLLLSNNISIICIPSIFNKNIFFNLKVPSLIDLFFTPTLLVQYKRDYLVSNCQNTRITLDSNLKFAPIRNKYTKILNTQFYETLDNVIEIKYDQNFNQPKIINDLSNEFNLTFSRFSKYCLGMRIAM